MSDFGNMSSQQGTIAPDAAQQPDHYEAHPIQYDEPKLPEQDAFLNPATPESNMTTQEQDDMNAITQAFDKARNAVIASSQLAKDVAALREVVESLRRSVESLQKDLQASRERNAMLDEHIAHARTQRDEARHLVSELSNENDTLRREQGSLQRRCRDFEETTSDQLSRISGLITDNDHFVTMIDSLEKERNTLRDKLAAIEAMFQPKGGDLTPTAQF